MQTDETPEADQPRQQLLTLPLILAVGWLIYEITAQPGLAAMAMCLKFGWEDIRTAGWLARHDPDRRRGRACYWLYLGSGLWKVAMTSLAMIFFIMALVAILQPRGQQARQLLPMVAGAGMTLVLGFGFSALACFVALVVAWKHRVRLWLNGAVARARLRDEWPPLYGQGNRVLGLVITTVIVTCMLLVPAGLSIACAALEDALPEKTKQAILVVGSAVSVMLVM